MYHCVVDSCPPGNSPLGGLFYHRNQLIPKSSLLYVSSTWLWCKSVSLGKYKAVWAKGEVCWPLGKTTPDISSFQHSRSSHSNGTAQEHLASPHLLCPHISALAFCQGCSQSAWPHRDKWESQLSRPVLHSLLGQQKKKVISNTFLMQVLELAPQASSSLLKFLWNLMGSEWRRVWKSKETGDPSVTVPLKLICVARAFASFLWTLCYHDGWALVSIPLSSVLFLPISHSFGPHPFWATLCFAFHLFRCWDVGIKPRVSELLNTALFTCWAYQPKETQEMQVRITGGNS